MIDEDSHNKNLKKRNGIWKKSSNGTCLLFYSKFLKKSKFNKNKYDIDRLMIDEDS